jgi:uncharacterized protein
MNQKEAEVVDNTAAHNFEIYIDGHRSFIDYKIRDGKIYLIHTEVPEVLQGKGIAASLVEKTLEYIERNGLKIVPLCSYVQAYLKRHPEWNRLVA